MIGRRDLPEHYLDWNARWGAPFGRVWHHLIPPGWLMSPPMALLAGPFAFQPGNNGIRRFEYPWAYHAVPIRKGSVVVDLGGSHAGFQFTLSRAGARVVNVDPGEEAAVGWKVSPATIGRLNRVFGTDVELRQCFLHEAGFADDSVDTVYSISTLEHVPRPDAHATMREIARILRPGGAAVLTIDLFLDLEPFTDRTENQVGINLDVRQLVEDSGMEMEQGDPDELYGFPGFDPKAVLSQLSSYQTGMEPALAQAVVLRKRA